MNSMTMRSFAAMFASFAAILLVLDNRLDLGLFADFVDFISGILIGIAGTLMVIGRKREQHAE